MKYYSLDLMSNISCITSLMDIKPIFDSSKCQDAEITNLTLHIKFVTYYSWNYKFIKLYLK